MDYETTYNFYGLEAVLEAVKVLQLVNFRYIPRDPNPSRPYVASLVVDSEYNELARLRFAEKGLEFSVCVDDD
jgi:hypothetical protein